jgi:hypothetical protein
MVLARQDLLNFLLALRNAKKKRQIDKDEDFDFREYLRMQEELRAAREKARLFDLLHRNRMF